MVQRVFFVAHGGVVQGVGFRYFARQRAQTYGLTGWCRNTSDNKLPLAKTFVSQLKAAKLADKGLRQRVEGEAQGEHDAVDKFLSDISQGPRHAAVAKLSREERPVVEGETSFGIQH